jgi:5-oxopent-3-ene-1,2,5-tricarboxylate decarboxylase / 2-hydroxyhepta-2,4-diene-1,7-dioate isomerase
MDHPLPTLHHAPWRLSGTVLVPLLNDPTSVLALGDAVNHAPYKAPPRAPVLALKPRNTLAGDGARVVLPAGVSAWTAQASVALVVARTATRLHKNSARAFVAGWTLALDFSVPHASHYRPAAAHKARDGSCVLGPRVVDAAAVPHPQALTWQLSVDGLVVQHVRADAMQRSAEQLLIDITEFMTLHAGDVVLLGAAHGAPQVHAGQRVEVRCEPVGTLGTQVVSS